MMREPEVNGYVGGIRALLQTMSDQRVMAAQVKKLRLRNWSDLIGSRIRDSNMKNPLQLQGDGFSPS